MERKSPVELSKTVSTWRLPTDQPLGRVFWSHTTLPLHCTTTCIKPQATPVFQAWHGMAPRPFSQCSLHHKRCTHLPSGLYKRCAHGAMRQASTDYHRIHRETTTLVGQQFSLDAYTYSIPSFRNNRYTHILTDLASGQYYPIYTKTGPLLNSVPALQPSST